MPGLAADKITGTAFHVESDQYGVIEDMPMIVTSLQSFYLKQHI